MPTNAPGACTVGPIALVEAAVLLSAAIAVPQAQDATAAVDLQGRLYRSVFQPGPGALADSDLSDVREVYRERLQRYLVRRASFTSRLENRAGGLADATREAKKRDIERAIVALVESPGAEAMALAFVADAPMDVWETDAEPLAEADYAERRLKDDPGGALAPFLYAFIAHRLRAAFEAQVLGKDEAAMKASAKKYRLFLTRARGVPDAIYALLADDLDRQPFVHWKTAVHPRDFNPDT